MPCGWLCGPQDRRRQNIRAAEREHQKHVRGPDADSLHLREILDHRLIVHPRQALENQILRAYACQERMYSVFCPERPSRRILVGAQFQDIFGRYFTARHGVGEAAENHARHFGR